MILAKSTPPIVPMANAPRPSPRITSVSLSNTNTLPFRLICGVPSAAAVPTAQGAPSARPLRSEAFSAMRPIIGSINGRYGREADFVGDTPLAMAAEGGHLDIVSALLDAGGIVDAGPEGAEFSALALATNVSNSLWGGRGGRVAIS